MTRIKTPSEILKIKEACRITDRIFRRIQVFLPKCTTETELETFILKEIKKKNVLPSFPPIVTSGKRAGNEIHPRPKTAPLEGFVIIDFGVIYKGYMSDMTRTVFVGKPNASDVAKYKKVLSAQLLGIKEIMPNLKCASIDSMVRTYLGPLEQYFIHTLGHGIGTRIHEPPHIYKKRTRDYFRVGMVVTVEPGIYIKDTLGIRIEDTCLVTQKGAIVLTKSTKELLTFRPFKIKV